jgi:hypothetical protein
MDREGFFPHALAEYLFFSSSPRGAMEHIEQAVASQ